jgi:hypothetical protein
LGLNLAAFFLKKRATLIWGYPSIEFGKDYLSVLCMDFDPPVDPLWWRRVKQQLLPLKKKKT